MFKSDDESVESYENRKRFNVLKSLRQLYDFEHFKERIEFLAQIYHLIEYWWDLPLEKLPHLRDFVPREELERLLFDCARLPNGARGHESLCARFVDFLLAIGYEDRQPELDETGRPKLLRPTPIHLAARRGKPSRALFKIYNRFELNFHDEGNLTHAHVAIERDYSDVVGKFLDAGLDVNSYCRRTGDSLLQLALYGRRLEEDCSTYQASVATARLLLGRGADPSWANKRGTTPLHIVCRMDTGGDDLARMLFEARGYEVRLDVQDSEGNTPLHLALARGDKGTAELLLRRGASPTLPNVEGLTALHVIGARGDDYWDLLRVFFETTVQVDPRDNWGCTPLHLALYRGDARTTEMLLRQGADPNTANNEGFTPLHVVCWERGRDDKLAETLFEVCDETSRELRVDARDRWANTPLHLALLRGDKRMAEALLRRGACPNLANNGGFTPLDIICTTTDLGDFVGTFLKICEEKRWPALIDAWDMLCRTPLQLALSHGNYRAAEALLRLGAEPNFIDEAGSTSLHVICAKQIYDVKFAELFFEVNEQKQRRVRIDSRDRLGNTPLHLALKNGKRWIAELLLSRGAEPTLADAAGRTPQELALDWKNGTLDGVRLFCRIDEAIRWRAEVQTGIR